MALVLVDVINGLDFSDSQTLAAAAAEVAPNIDGLRRSAHQHEVPVIYVNDNFGMWQSDFRAVAERCMRPGLPGSEVTRRLLPEPQDYFVLKPRHSGFLATPLEALLAHLEVNLLLLAGFATNLCVLFTALDAHARGFHVAIARDATAANDWDAHRTALTLLEQTLGAPLLASAAVDWQALAKRERRPLF